MAAWLSILLASLPGASDPALVNAAAIHAREVLADERAANLDRVRWALDEAGLADPQIVPFAAVGTSTGSLREELAAFVGDHIAYRGITHHGQAMVRHPRGRATLVAFFVRRLVELPLLPLSPKGKGVRLRGQPLRTAALRAYVSMPSGKVRMLRITHDERFFQLDVRFAEGDGCYTVEIVADTERGPEVAALWNFYRGVSANVRKRPPKALGLPDTRTTLQALVRRSRIRAGLGPLSTHVALAKAAQGHAEAICEAMLAAHVLPGGTNPVERARALGFTGAVKENVAIAASVARAHENLLASPSHRRNVLDPTVRLSGYGLAQRRGRTKSFCVVEVFAP